MSLYFITTDKCHLSGKRWAIGNIKSTTQVVHLHSLGHPIYLGSEPSADLAEFEIIVCHNIHKENLYEQAKKAKLELKFPTTINCAFFICNSPFSSTSSTIFSASEKIYWRLPTGKPQKREKPFDSIQDYQEIDIFPTNDQNLPKINTR